MICLIVINTVDFGIFFYLSYIYKYYKMCNFDVSLCHRKKVKHNQFF